MRLLLTFAAIVIALVARPALAHEGRPLFVQLVESEAGQVQMFVAVPPSIPADNRPRLTLGGACRPDAEKEVSRFQEDLGYRCEAAGLKGAVLDISYPRGNPAVTTLLLTRLADGSETVETIPPETTRHRFGLATSMITVAIDYVRLGIVHILSGIDHLLFVFGLFLLSRNWRQLLVVLTGFTIAHSLTLAASTLGWVNLPVAPTEAVIALSIVFVARELLGGDNSLAKRFPVVVAFSFGLLHGFGFASVLRDTGLPEDNLLSALLFFNVGVEFGQIAFVAALALITAIYRLGYSHWPGHPPAYLGAHASQRTLAAYSLGAIATMWFLQRSTGMLA